MKKILIICDTFAPYNSVSAIRITKIAKYLSIEGYNVTVVCGGEKSNLKIDPFLQHDMKYIKNIFEVKENFIVKKVKLFLQKISSKNVTIESNKNNNAIIENKKIKKTINYLVYFKKYFSKINPILLNLFYIYEAYAFHFNCKNVIRKKLKKKQFDIIITSFSPISSHLTGKYLKKKWKIKWIADFRDPMDNVIISNTFFSKLRRKMQANFIKEADIVTCVSKGLKKHLIYSSNDKYSHKIKVIYNGYDENDFRLMEICGNEQYEDKIKLVYSGSLYNGMRNIRPLFNAINLAIEKKKIKKENIILQYMGGDGEELKKQSGNLVDCIIDYGVVDRKKSLEIQNDSDIIIVVTWNNPGTANQGVIPIKFFEALMLKKYILLLVTGSEASCELSEIIETCNCGVIYQESLNNNEVIYNLLDNLDKIKGKFLYNDVKEKYSWNNLIELFIREIENL